MKNIKYIVLVLLFLFSCKIQIKAEGHLWSEDELPTRSFDELKECTYKKSLKKGDINEENAYVEITSENKVRASIGDYGLKQEVYNWTQKNGTKYWTGKLQFQAKEWYIENEKCLDVLIDSDDGIYLTTWTNFFADYKNLKNPKIYYISRGSQERVYTCSYTSKNNSTYNVEYGGYWQMINFKSSKNTGVSSTYNYSISGSTLYNYNSRQGRDYCPTIYVCNSKNYDSPSQTKYYYTVYNDPSFIVLDDYESTADCDVLVCNSGEKCDPKKSERENKEGLCMMFDMYMSLSDSQNSSLELLATSYGKCKQEKNCSQKEQIDYLNAYNKRLDELKLYCENYISNNDYDEINPGCMKKCLGLKDTVYSLEVENNIIRSSDSDCPISASIISFVYNILKWAKYIVPALVVILSILDFIKAIASQSEDDMKKAQGKFVKRLIVAAILFLLPLIVNFMLKTFGLYNSTCDITNLFG